MFFFPISFSFLSSDIFFMFRLSLSSSNESHLPAIPSKCKCSFWLIKNWKENSLESLDFSSIQSVCDHEIWNLDAIFEESINQYEGAMLISRVKRNSFISSLTLLWSQQCDEGRSNSFEQGTLHARVELVIHENSAISLLVTFSSLAIRNLMANKWQRRWMKS